MYVVAIGAVVWFSLAVVVCISFVATQVLAVLVVILLALVDVAVSVVAVVVVVVIVLVVLEVLMIMFSDHCNVYGCGGGSCYASGK